jgi:uncharacterized membrane protein YeiH
VSQDLIAILVGDPFAAVNTMSLVAFAFVGSSKPIREEFDVFGVLIVGLAMAFAGGVTRDLLVTRVPLAIQSPIEISLGLFDVGLAIALSVVSSSLETHPVTLVADDFGRSHVRLGSSRLSRR